jgi:parvulin-like peptidyl-prolyl isomerase
MGFSGKTGKLATCGDDEIAMFKDAIFAFSTDNGSLQDNDGYVYSPKTSKTKYVEEFAEAAKNIVSQGVGAYTVVATEFGYHILLCSKVIDPTTTAIAQDKFIADLLVKDSIPYLFKEYQKARLVADNASKITSKFFKDNLDSSVEYFEKTYKDLMKEDK